MASTETSQPQSWQDVTLNSYNGIKLYARHHPGNPIKRPLLCLPNITENGRSFTPLAEAISRHEQGSRSVYCLDFRGRGLSQHDPDWNNYTPLVEMLDIVNFISATRLHQPIILASGWSGVITMTLATLYPTMIGPLIFNDTGPKLETTGLIRLQAFIGRLPTPTSWRKAAELIKELNQNHFTDLRNDDWLRLAHQQYNDNNGHPEQAYDPNLEKTLVMVDATEGTPLMWDQFNATKHVPMLVIRGENSDVLSKETFEKMATDHPNLQRFTVANEGHTPRLDDDLSIERIRLFLDQCDNEQMANLEET